MTLVRVLRSHALWVTATLVLVTAARPADAQAPPRAAAERHGIVRLAPWTGQPIVVNVAPGRTTAITFPAAITSIVTTAAKDQVTIETVGARLFLSPLVPSYTGEFFVILANDDQVPVVASPTDPAQADLTVRVTPGTANPPGAAGGGGGDKTGRWTPLRLMRSMILGIEEPGVTVTRSPEPVVVYNDAVLVLRSVATWKTPRYEGVLLEAENLTTQWLRLALESMHFPGLLAVHAERDSLAPKPVQPEAVLAAQQRTRVYLVRQPE
jgi:hypothetical protein